jgi:hypothetical protein
MSSNFGLKQRIALGLLVALMASGCAGLKRTVKETGKNLNVRQDIIGQPVDDDAKKPDK